MNRAYYSNSIDIFLKQSPDEILGEIVRNNSFALEQKQRNTWIYEINLLQGALENIPDGSIAFEYTIPRIGDRIDNVILCRGIIYLIEFKVGEHDYPKHAIEQIVDYSLDLKYFHKESHYKKIVPILVCTNAPSKQNEYEIYDDGIYKTFYCNKNTLKATLEELSLQLNDSLIKMEDWLDSIYMPTPTIIEAAQALYRGHKVNEISRSDSDAYNLSQTTEAINKIINHSKKSKQKSICFITGVPGAGKTLAGLNIANERHSFSEEEHAVFLSGNGPLVFVLREALARDEYKRLKGAIKKGQSKQKVEAFIQNIHHFRDDAIKSTKAPIEKVAIFDEAQRAWTEDKTAKFMAERGNHDWNKSEPEFLISVMDRHNDWAVIVCLIGGGQEINTGEAGLPAWFDALRNHFSYWNVFVSRQITDTEYTRGTSVKKMLRGLKGNIVDELHLAVSLRSFRSERVSAFIKSLLDIDVNTAQISILN